MNLARSLPVFCYSKCGEHSEGLYWLYKALKEDDQYVDALVSVSAALIKLGNLTEAAQHLNRAEQISPESKDVYNQYGLLMEKKGRHLILSMVIDLSPACLIQARCLPNTSLKF